MKKIGIACFTERGKQLAGQLAGVLGAGGQYEILRYEKGLRQWCGMCFEQAEALIFIGACGIAVRTIAPFLKSKTTDPAVLVLDEAGQFVISLLSGHIGGANELACELAEKIGAVPVITTASDVNGKIAVDVFAKKNGLSIASMKAAKEIAAAILRREKVGVYCEGRVEDTVPPELWLLSQSSKSGAEAVQKQEVKHFIWISVRLPEPALLPAGGTVLSLIPKAVVIGIGCRRGKPVQEIRAAAENVLAEEGISPKALLLAASIDLKKEEQGILDFCESCCIDFVTYPAEELLRVEGDFSPSEFVKKTTGVDNVCERAALLAAGEGGVLIRKKTAANGITVALAVRPWSIRFQDGARSS